MSMLIGGYFTHRRTDVQIFGRPMNATPGFLAGSKRIQTLTVSWMDLVGCRILETTSCSRSSQRSIILNPKRVVSALNEKFFLRLLSSLLYFLNLAYPARCAHCVSGQTIGMALEEINNHPESFTAPAYLVNLGAMDILMGRDIYSIQTDYKLLIDRLRGMNKLPICTTVSPVGISQEESRIWSQLYQKLLLFNRFVEDLVSQLSLPFIDFWHPFSNAKGVPVMQYYQKWVSVRFRPTNELRLPKLKYSFLFRSRLTTVVADEQVIKFHMWNKLGRTALKSTLGSYLDN